MRILVVSDPHLTDRAADEYRWDLFRQLEDISKAEKATTLIILGDLTEFKDYHSSALVNRLMTRLQMLVDNSPIEFIHVLKGNHDGIDPDTPYFGFLDMFEWCAFHTIPTRYEQMLFLPHTRDPEKDWEGVDFSVPRYIFLHGTVTGAVSETGHKLEGIPAALFDGCRARIIAGDIHVPQIVHGIEYVGAPYPIRFGDSFEPRAMLLTDNNKPPRSIPLKAPRKITLRVQLSGEINGPTVQRGDFVKVVLELREAELHEFHGLKQATSKLVKDAGGTLQKVQLEKLDEGAQPYYQKAFKLKKRTPEQELVEYCKRNKVAKDLADLGLELINS